jgi:mono/diheme cytochrome c family protein
MRRIGLLGLLLCWACENGGGTPGAFSSFQPGPTPPALHQGEVFFNTYCLSCHGLHGTGEGLGPALLDTLFLADRLSDEQMLGAVERGVPQTHFHYGAMPPVKRLSREQTAEIIGYVRWLQARAATTLGTTP